MKAKIIRSYACAPEGHTVLKFDAGTEVEGEIARMALADGAAAEINEAPALETKIEAPEETKAAAKKKAKKG